MRTPSIVLEFVVCLALFLDGGEGRPCRADDWFGRDKSLHFSVSMLLAGGGYAAAAGLSPREETRVAVASGFAFSMGIAKEVYDRYSGGDPSLRDLTWDLVGTASGTLLTWLIDHYLF